MGFSEKQASPSSHGLWSFSAWTWYPPCFTCTFSKHNLAMSLTSLILSWDDPHLKKTWVEIFTKCFIIFYHGVILNIIFHHVRSYLMCKRRFHFFKPCWYQPYRPGMIYPCCFPSLNGRMNAVPRQWLLQPDLPINGRLRKIRPRVVGVFSWRIVMFFFFKIGIPKNNQEHQNGWSS